MGKESLFQELLCKPRTYLLEEQTPIPWDYESLYDPALYAEYRNKKAATKIQASYRGYITRKRVDEEHKQHSVAAVVVQAAFRGYLVRRQLGNHNGDSRQGKQNYDSLYDPNLYPEYRNDEAATKIQALYRGHMTRKRVDEEYKQRSVAALIIQAAFRRYLVQRQLRNHKGFSKQGEMKPPYPQERYPKWDEPRKDSVPRNEGHKREEGKTLPVSNEPGSSFPGSDALIPSGPNISFINDQSPECQKNVIYALGGFKIEDDCTRSNVLLCYSPSDNVWKDIGVLPEPRYNARLALIDGFLFCIGGCHPGPMKGTKMIPKAECYRYHINRRQWVEMAPLKRCRMFHGVAVLNGIIYAVGGQDHKSRILSSVEQYDPSVNRWSESPPMRICRMSMGVTAYNEMIWIIGGMTGEGNELFPLDIVECFDPRTWRWEIKIELPHPIAFLALVECRNTLYSIGGATQESLEKQELISVNEVYAYNQTNNYWSMIESLPSPLHSVVASSLGDDIYIVGGYSVQNFAFLQEVVYYDSVLRRWRTACRIPPSAAGRITAAVGSESNE